MLLIDYTSTYSMPLLVLLGEYLSAANCLPTGSVQSITFYKFALCLPNPAPLLRFFDAHKVEVTFLGLKGSEIESILKLDAFFSHFNHMLQMLSIVLKLICCCATYFSLLFCQVSLMQRIVFSLSTLIL